jgi:hypothetical protein
MMKSTNNEAPRVSFEVLTAASMKMAVFWVAATCGLVKVYRCFRGACCFRHRPYDEATSTSETSVNFYQSTQRNTTEDSHLGMQLSPVFCYYLPLRPKYSHDPFLKYPQSMFIPYASFTPV